MAGIAEQSCNSPSAPDSMVSHRLHYLSSPVQSQWTSQSRAVASLTSVSTPRGSRYPASQLPMAETTTPSCAAICSLDSPIAARLPAILPAKQRPLPSTVPACLRP